MSNKQNPTKSGRSSEQTKDVCVTAFRGRPLPIPAHLAGYSALIDRHALAVPLHHEMAAVSPKTLRHREGGWKVLPSSLRPGESDVEQLMFALKYEGIQLLTLKKVFEAFEPMGLVEAARTRPTSGYLRRLCHLYEWLLDRRLDVPDVSAGSYVDLIDATQQYGAASGSKVRRFRVSHNLPGTRAFCPIVFKTHRIDAFIARDLARKAREVVDSAPRELIARAAAFLILSDSKASFAIEGENPPRDRLTRWGSAIGKAGDWRLDREALIGLQRSLIADDRFVKLGLRT